ncbi:MAG: TrbI/VirB10 family protein [Desulfobulbus sp.]|nr:TrbI/VirB10 family protein [Desulfobulbus sp.]
MSDGSPNSLKPPKVTTTRMKKWPLYAVALVVLGLFGVLFYSVNYGSVSRKQSESKPAAVASEKSLVNLEGHGLSLPPTADIPAVIAPPEAEAAKRKEPLVVVRTDSNTENEDALKLERERKRAKEQSVQEALKSPLIAKRMENAREEQKTTTTPAQRGMNQAAMIQQAGLLPEQSPVQDFNTADRDKEQFLSRSGQDEWRSPYTREPGNPFEIKTGTVIPGIMISGINSDLPGSLIAQVSQNVYDTATGHHLLIPQGSKLYGVYDSRVVYGQSRVLVAWNRLNFPDGSAVTLGAMPGTDISGYAGYEDQVNNHYLRIFGSSLLMSLITGGTSYAMDNVSNSSDNSDGTSVQDAMAAALAAQMGQATLSLLQKNLNIKPTLEIRPGYQFNVIVTKDVVFQKPYTRLNNG